MYQTGNFTKQGALTLANFPDSESVRIQSLGYPAGVCGENLYFFFHALQNVQVPYLSYGAGGSKANIYFTPKSTDPPGIFPIRIYAIKASYPTIPPSTMTFVVTINLDAGG